MLRTHVNEGKGFDGQPPDVSTFRIIKLRDHTPEAPSRDSSGLCSSAYSEACMVLEVRPLWEYTCQVDLRNQKCCLRCMVFQRLEHQQLITDVRAQLKVAITRCSNQGCELELDDVNDWPVAYHGTSCDKTKSIL